MKRALLLTTLLACSPPPRAPAPAEPTPSPSPPPSPSPSPSPSPADQGQPPLVEIKTAEYEVGQPGTVTLVVTNRSPYPILIDLARLALGGTELLRETHRRELAALADDHGALQVRGTYWVDDVGPAARAPAPPKWTWAGGTPVLMVRLLLPEEAHWMTAPIRPADTSGGTLVAAVSYTELAGPVAHYKVATARISKPSRVDGPGAGGSMKATTVRALRLEPRTAQPGGKTTLDWPKSPPPDQEDPAVTAELLFMLPDVLLRQRHDIVTAEAPLTVREPRFTLAAARKIVGVAAGPAARIIDSDYWAIQGSGVTWVASPEEGFKVAGDAIWLVESLNDNPAAIVMLHVGDAKKDPGKHLAFLKAAGVAIRLMDGKDGSTSAVAEMTRRSVVQFLLAVSRRKLRIDGKSHRVEPM
jgi:hypothetical protein